MDTTRIKQLKLARPFRPFYMLLRDGRRYFVGRSYQIGLAPDGSRLGVSVDTGVVLLRPDDVRDIDVIVPAVG